MLFFRANDVPNSEGGFPIENILTQIREMRKKKLNYWVFCDEINQ